MNSEVSHRDVYMLTFSFRGEKMVGLSLSAAGLGVTGLFPLGDFCLTSNLKKLCIK